MSKRMVPGVFGERVKKSGRERGKERYIRESIQREKAKMSTKRMGKGEKRVRVARWEGDRRTDSWALKFMAFFIFHAENQYCLLWMR